MSGQNPVDACGSSQGYESIEASLARMFDEPVVVAPDDRPELAVAIESAIDRLTRPPVVYVRVEAGKEPARVFSSQAVSTAAEAILRVLTRLIRELQVPTRVRVTTDDPTVLRMFSSGITAPAWLRAAADDLEYEASSGDVSLVVAGLTHGEEGEEASYGSA